MHIKICFIRLKRNNLGKINLFVELLVYFVDHILGLREMEQESVSYGH